MIRRFLSGRDPYQVLGVGRTASKHEVKQAYLRMAKYLHPDVNSSPNAAVQFKEAAAAYEALRDGSSSKESSDDEWRERSKRRQDAVTPLERVLGPTRLAMLLVIGFVALFFPSSSSRPKDIIIEDCWYNPKTRRLEPPAPWDPDYRAAAAAGALRAVPKSQLT